jgi:hypothetical protein
MSFQRQVSRMLDNEHRANLDLLGEVEQAFVLAPWRRTALNCAGRPVRTEPGRDVGRHFDFEEQQLFPRMADR